MLKMFGEVLRYGGVVAAAALGYATWADTQNAVAATNAMQPAAVAFTLGEAIRMVLANNPRPNSYQTLGHLISLAAPFAATYALADSNYQPLLDFGMIVPWALAQGLIEIGDRKQIYELGREVVSKGMGYALDFLDAHSGEDDLIEYVGRLRRKMKHE